MPTDALAALTRLTHTLLLQDYEVKLQEIQALQEEKKVHCTQYNCMTHGWGIIDFSFFSTGV